MSVNSSAPDKPAEQGTDGVPSVPPRVRATCHRLDPLVRSKKLQYNAQSLAYINMLGGLTHAKEFLPCVTTAYTVCARAQRKSATG